MSRIRSAGLSIGLAFATVCLAAGVVRAQETGERQDSVSILIRNESGQSIRVEATRVGTEPVLEEFVQPHSVRLLNIAHDAFGSGEAVFEFMVGQRSRPMSHYRTQKGLRLPPGGFVLIDIPRRIADLSVTATATYGAENTGTSHPDPGCDWDPAVGCESGPKEASLVALPSDP